MPTTTITSLEIPVATTVRQDINTVLVSAVDAMDNVQAGLTAFLNVAGDNGSEFSNTAHWMVSQIDTAFSRCMALTSAAQNAFRVESLSADRERATTADEAAERLRALA